MITVKFTLYGIPQRTLTIDEAFDYAEEEYGEGNTLEEYVEMFNNDYNGKGIKARIQYDE